MMKTVDVNSRDEQIEKQSGGSQRIAVGAGDGIGPEIMAGALKVLQTVGNKYGNTYETVEYTIGGKAIDTWNDPFPDSQLAICKSADAVLLGAVGGPAWDDVPPETRPEKGLLKIRKELGLYANLRPAVIYQELKSASPIKDSILGDGLDLLVVRELVGGIYFGERSSGVSQGIRYASDTECYDETEIRRIARVAFDSARKRRNKVTSVDKANVLTSSRLWRTVVGEVARDYPDVELNHLYVDNAAMQLVLNPRQFDVILTNNIFGDILSDEASQITGSIGMLPSASLGGDIGLYEPIHGSAPDIVGTGKANPLATILSVALMLRYSFGQEEEAHAIETQVRRALADGLRTADIYRDIPGQRLVVTEEMTQAVVDGILRHSNL